MIVGGCLLEYGRMFHYAEEDEDGIVLSDMAPVTEAETAAGRFYNERIAKGLKFDKPDLSTFKNGFLNEDMTDILQSYMEFDDMPDDVSEYWAKFLLENEGMEPEYEVDGDDENGFDLHAL